MHSFVCRNDRESVSVTARAWENGKFQGAKGENQSQDLRLVRLTVTHSVHLLHNEQLEDSSC